MALLLLLIVLCPRLNHSQSSFDENSVMGFIFYGKEGEISTNKTEEQALSVACLHLLQVCMVYINTLIIQDILSNKVWFNKLTLEDKRAITPLIHAHINPYGLFPLDLYQRLNIESTSHQEEHNDFSTHASEAESETISQVSTARKSKL